MANIKIKSTRHEYALVEEAPEVGGFWTDPVSMVRNGANLVKIFFSVREAVEAPVTPSLVKITMQFKCPTDTFWTDYYNNDEDHPVGERGVVEGFSQSVEWRAGVKEGDYSSGAVKLGFDW